MPKVLCKLCKKEFYAKPNWIKNGLGKYCSRKCSHESAKKGKMVECFICKKEIYKSQKALKGSRSQKFFCNKSCQTIWRNSILNIGDNHPNWKSGKYVSYRSILLKNKVLKICSLCGNIDSRILAVHHIDENHKNNNLENLAWLCHNCHFLVHNHTKERQAFLKKIK